MKKLMWLAVFTCTVCGTYAQDKTQVRNLATLGKVWGFLKYYHTAAAKGQPDWDKELLRMIPLVERAASQKEAAVLLENWYRSLPAASLSATPVNWKADSIDRVFTEKDIIAFALPASFTTELKHLYDYHQPDSNRYITRTYRGIVYDHIIHTEDDFDTPTFPDRPMRLLALFRYWNTITYFYPYRIAGWGNVLPDYIRRFSRAASVGEYRQAIRELIHELPDSHSFIQEPGSVHYFYPFRIDYIDGKYLVGSCDDSMRVRYGYRPGDEIVAIDGKPVADRERMLMKTVTGTNPLSLHRNIAAELLKGGDTILQVAFKRGGVITIRRVELHSWEVYRRLPRTPEKPLWQELQPGVWYVRFCAIQRADTLQRLFRDIRQAGTVIWDMRAYPSYQVTTQLGNFLFKEKETLTMERNAADQYPGTFISSHYHFTPDAKVDSIFKGRIIVLVDEHTQSLAESVCAMLQLRPNTITMGRQTAGTTGNITWFSLPGGINVSYTGVGVIGMKSSFRQRSGVKIDIPIRLTQQALQRNQDFILEQAIEYAQR